MASALSPYWSPHHRRPADYQFMQELQPAVVKLMDAGRPDYDFAKSLASRPVIIARDWAISEQHDEMLADPIATAREHAEFWRRKQLDLGFSSSNTLCLGINEPRVWNPGVPAALSLYTVEFLKQLNAFGLRGGALQLSVGWPGNHGTGTKPDWSIFPGVEEAIKRYNGALIVHEYWADQGPGENWGWWGGRFMSCPWQVPIIIGECGIDMAVKQGGVPHDRRGWRAVTSATAYASQLREYVTRAKSDPRFFAATVFELDYASKEWESFDVEPCWQQIVASCKDVPANRWFVAASVPPVGPVPPLFPPAAVGLPLAIGSYHLTQRFYQNPEDYKRYGFPGHNGTDLGVAQGKSVLSVAAGQVAYVDKDPAYGYYVRVWHKELGCHSFYAHLMELPSVAVGSQVAVGQKLGLSGSTGNSTGPHLHLEIRLCDAAGRYRRNTPMSNGRIDPESWMALYGLKF